MIHLHSRSSYSLLKSTLTISQLVQKSKKMGFECVCLTDESVMYGVMEFRKMCDKEDLKAIIGLEVPVTVMNGTYPFLLLAKNDSGYFDLCHLSTYLSNHNAITMDEFKSYLSNCFCIVYGEGGPFESIITGENEFEIMNALHTFKVELEKMHVALSYNDSSFWKTKNQILKRCCVKEGIKTVALNKIYYEKDEDALNYKVVNAIRDQKIFRDSSLPILKGRYIRSYEEMAELYDSDDLQETDNIASQCNVTFQFPKTSLPAYTKTKGVTSAEYLKQLCVLGLTKRMNGRVTKEYADRLKYELNVIISMHFEDYFLIVYDFILHAKKQNVYVGPGRGSAAGSLVSYSLGICDIDPIKYDLLFERFLNPERISMPDIDTDFPDYFRDEVIRYVFELYGSKHVAHIITFNTLGAKQVIRDVSKVMELNSTQIDMLCSMIPNRPKITLKEAFEENKRLKDIVHSDSRYEEVFKIAFKLEGLPRHTSVHAAGIVLSSLDLNNVLPLSYESSEIASTQFTMEHLEELGLIKMDFLALRNLSIIEEIVKEIKKQDENFDVFKIPLDDASTYKLIQNCNTSGVFQLDSDGMKNLLRKMKCTHFNDICAAVALFRPGPMENIDRYLKNKQAPEKIIYENEIMKQITESTYGIMIYQEQIMKLTQLMAGFSLAKADTLRKAVSKKNMKTMETLKQDFLNGSIANGYDIDLANALFDKIEKFAGYGFNKSHSVAYGLLAYQMAYLKANYPLAFYKAICNGVIGNDIKMNEYLQEIRNSGLNVLYPDINKADANISIKNDSLQLGLSCIKGIGANQVINILKEREKKPFEDIFDFVARMSIHKFNKKMFENVIDAGGCDCFRLNRETLRGNLDDILKYSDLVKIENNDQISIDLELISKPRLISIKEDPNKKRQLEKAALGVNIGPDPIIEIRRKMKLQTLPLIRYKQYLGSCTGFGRIVKVKQHKTKTGMMMAFAGIVDESGDLDLVIMPKLYEKVKADLVKDNYIYFHGKIDKENSCLVDKMQIVKEN